VEVDSTIAGASVAGATGVSSLTGGSCVTTGSSVGGTTSVGSVVGGVVSSANTVLGNPSDDINENKITRDKMLSFFVYFIVISPFHP
jgi:hypothetical protein